MYSIGCTVSHGRTVFYILEFGILVFTVCLPWSCSLVGMNSVPRLPSGFDSSLHHFDLKTLT